MSSPTLPKAISRIKTKILGIDSSLTSTGMCRVSMESVTFIDHAPANAWNIDAWKVLSKPGIDRTALGMSNRIAEIITAMEPHIAAADLVVLEGIAFSANNPGVFARHWLWGRIVDTCMAHATELITVTPNLRCKYATGKGNAQKDAVLAAAIRRWPDVDIDGNDIADALVLAAIGCRSRGTPIDDVPRAYWEPLAKKGLC